MPDFTAHGPQRPNPRVTHNGMLGQTPTPPSHLLPPWPKQEPLPPPPGAEAGPATPTEESDRIRSKKRSVKEQSYPWWVRLFRFLTRTGETTYELADAFEVRFDQIDKTLRQYSREQGDATSSLNEQATTINRMARLVAEANHRLVYYEQHVPQLRRAREEYDQIAKEKEVAQEADRLLRQPPINDKR